jgi:hypothetical protein
MHLDHLNDVFWRYETIWFARVGYDPRLLNRLNQRAFVNQAETVVIRRFEGRIVGQCSLFDIYASAELSGRFEPTTWRPLLPIVAIATLAEQSLSLPGLFTSAGITPVTYSKGWKKVRDYPNTREDRYEILGLAQSESVFKTAEMVVAEEARGIFGEDVLPRTMRVTFETMPREHRDWWVKRIKEEISRQVGGRT